MTKKYSVQMENDEIVSVEVDGVAYKNPEDIPGEQDREKIKALVSRTADANSDEDSDEGLDAEFAKEFQEMESQSSVFPKLLVGIFLAVAAITLTIAAFSAYSAVQTISKEKSAPGRVVKMVDRTFHDSSTGDVTQYSYPVVEFALPGQQPRTVQMQEGASPPDYSVDDQVTVLYDPQQPRNARIKSFSSDLLLWLLPGITFIVGATFAGVAVVVLKVWPPK
jgi:hypothetical protein